jgi:hypothetical protein
LWGGAKRGDGAEPGTPAKKGKKSKQP